MLAVLNAAPNATFRPAIKCNRPACTVCPTAGRSQPNASDPALDCSTEGPNGEPMYWCGDCKEEMAVEFEALSMIYDTDAKAFRSHVAA